SKRDWSSDVCSSDLISLQKFKATLKKVAWFHFNLQLNTYYISVLPIIAFDNVTSSAYSKSPPTESPCANRVTVKPIGLTSLDIYIAVDSPSKLGFIAKISSFTSSFFKRLIKLGILISSGPMPSIGEIEPCNTWYKPLYSRIFSIAITSLSSSTTQIIERSLCLSWQI